VSIAVAIIGLHSLYVMAAVLVYHMMTNLLEILEEFVEDFDIIDDNGWWCPDCGPTDCTYEGHCTSCGLHIENAQPSAGLLKRAQDAIIHARREQ